jgi:transposase InsO family protein
MNRCKRLQNACVYNLIPADVELLTWRAQKMTVQVPIRIQTGAPVRIDGKEFSAGPVISGGRVFYDKEAGTQIVLSEVAQMRMALDLRLRDARPFDKLGAARRHALRIDWGTFTPEERRTALVRALFVRKLDKVAPANNRSKKKVISRIVAEIGRKWKIPEDRWPSPRQVRTWYRTFVTAGRDVRGLVPCTWAKGNREPRYTADWVVDILNDTINKEIVTQTPASYRTTKLLAEQAIRDAAAQRGEAPPLLGKANGIGGKLISRIVSARNKFEVMVGQCDVREARRQFHSVQLGPQGSEVNGKWEVDHTLLDVFVIDEETGQVAGRPWLTTIMDRYSRCIVGFSMSFAPPSWASVMDALRVAISRKEPYLAHYIGFKNAWNCYGVPGTLITDHGRDFKSDSMEEARHALGFRLRHVLPKKPWLKGKIERWFRTLEEEIVHVLPGTVFSRFEDRKFYNSEKYAVLTIHELNWIVAKWIIDVYHQRPHGKLGTSPANMWADGLKEIPLLREVPDDLLVPMMGLVVPRALRNGGIRFLGLRWDSEEFGEVRAYLPDSANVQVRIDPLDISTCYIFDERRKRWIEGKLIEPTEARGLNLNQWATVKRLKKMIQEQEGLEADEAIAEAIADLRAFVGEIKRSRGKNKAPNRLSRFMGETPWQRVRPDRRDPDHEPPKKHLIGIVRVKSPPLSPMGPFEDVRRKPRDPEWPPEEAETEESRDEAGADDPADKSEEGGGEDVQATIREETKTRRRRKSGRRKAGPERRNEAEVKARPAERTDGAEADGDDGEMVVRRRGYGDAGEE